MYPRLFRLRASFLVLLICIAGILLILPHAEYILLEWELFPAPKHTINTPSKLIAKYQYRLDNIVKKIHGFERFNETCSQLSLPAVNNVLIKTTKSWQFSESLFRKEIFENATNKCLVVRNKLAFIDEPLSEEEKDFPLAYGFLVYKSTTQIYLLLSAIYQPQNAYCIAVDAKSSEQFKGDMDLLADCFPNIFVFQVAKVKWCDYTIVRGVMTCMRYLSELNHQWRYVQYLSGVDLPLKTNLEMVRIFKRLNGTINAEVTLFPPERFKDAPNKNSPLPMWKSSLSSLLPRATVNALVKSNKVRDLLSYLQLTYCPDESLWTTMGGNIADLPVPGSFNASAIYAKLVKERFELNNQLNSSASTVQTKITLEEPFVLHDYYISRYQVWASTKNYDCSGRMVQGSCVFGIGDLKNLVTRPELVAHKFYLTVEPAAYFCLYYILRSRALDYDSQSRFQGSVYAQLPQVRMAAGANLQDVNFYFSST